MLTESSLHHNAHTTFDATEYFAIGLANRLTPMLLAEAARMRLTCDELTEQHIILQRAVVLNELDYRSSAASDALFAMYARVYGAKHPYAQSVGGTREQVSSISRDDLCQFLSRHYHPRGAQLVISGNFDPAKAQRLVVQLFSMIKPIGSDAEAVDAVLPSADRSGLYGTSSRYPVGVSEPRVWVVFGRPAMAHDDRLAGRLGRELLRWALFSVMREKTFVTAVDLDDTGGGSAPLLVAELTVTELSKATDAVEALFEAIATQRDDLTEPELIGAREKLRASLLFESEGFGSRAQLFGRHFAAGDSSRFLLGDLQKLAGIDAQMVVDYVDRAFARSASHVAFLEPSEDAKRAAGGLLAQAGGVVVDHAAEIAAAAPTDDTVAPLELSTRLTLPRAHRFALDNGMNVVLVPTLSYPVVEMRLVLPVGSIHEPANRPGLASTTAALMGPDPRQRISRGQLFDLQLFDQMGGDFNSSVDETTTTFTASGLAMYADVLIWQLYWRTHAGRPSEKGLAALRKLWSRETATPRQRSVRRFAQSVADALYGSDHPYARRSSVGESLRGISHDDLVDFRDRYYRPNGATVIVTGRFDGAALEAEIRRLFGGWSGSTGGELPAVAAATKRKGIQHLFLADERADQLMLGYGFATRPGFRTDHAARLVVAEIMRIKFRALRTKLGATYGVDVSLSSRHGPGELLVTTFVDPDLAARVHLAATAILDDVRSGALVAEFVTARKRVVQRLLAERADSRSVAAELEALATYGGGAGYYQSLLEDVARLTPGDLASTVAADMPANGAVVVASGPSAALRPLARVAGVAYHAVAD